jgi:hypothetical protein
LAAAGARGFPPDASDGKGTNGTCRERDFVVREKRDEFARARIRALVDTPSRRVRVHPCIRLHVHMDSVHVCVHTYISRYICTVKF